MAANVKRARIPGIPAWVRRRIGFSLMVLAAAIVINFMIPRLMPGDISYLFTSASMDPTVADQILERLGLNESLWVQFVLYIKGIFTLDFGQSYYFSGTSVASMIAETLPRTLLLLIPAEIISVIIGYFLGTSAGWKPGSKKDSFITGVGLIIWSVPMFWMAMLVLYIGGFELGWFPLRGFETVGADYGFFGTIWDRLQFLILPTIALSTKFGVTELVMRNTMTITIKQNYITTAKAKGLSETRVKHRHAARNALMPTVTAAAMRFAQSVAGLIFIEKVFSYPGMGKMIFDAVNQGDFPVIQGAFLVFAVVVIAVIFVLDIVYARLDPRVRYN